MMGDLPVTAQDLEQADRIVSAWWLGWGGMCAGALAGQDGLVKEIARAIVRQREADAQLAERLIQAGRLWRIVDAIRRE